MRDLVDAAVLALLVGALFRTLRELHRERQISRDDYGDAWPTERVERDERKVN